MTTINQLSSSTPVSSDLVPFYSQSNGDSRKASFNTIATLIQSLITSTIDYLTQYSAPSATGFTVTVTDNGSNVWLLLTPTAGFAAGTITLPNTAVVDKQEVLINCTQVVTTLTVAAGTVTVTGAPAALNANDYFRMRYDGVTAAWYRVG
jgi:hypothetical protein